VKLTNKERTFIAHALDHLKNNTIDDVEYGGFGGWYMGNRQHFIKRHTETIAYFNNLLNPQNENTKLETPQI
jgi:hypothetical protein